ncbi:alkaline phosphatase family protein [Novosphingobium sp.]|uniref:alkaline phosphatase family protein n=1 Tax=Novosphingobium sp. TaxID=1874826 RepID=UPI0038BBA656
MTLSRKAALLLATLSLPFAPAALARTAHNTAHKAPVAPVAAPARAVPANAPRLLVAIAVDQFSADLFAQYRSHFTGGLGRLQQGAVFPAGYQSHAATETCPGHSTILTGMRPAHTGIIANNWIDQSVTRAKKVVYCAEDETRTAADPKDYVASVGHLLVPTLGERIKAVWPTSRNLAVSGKDRATLMMGGHVIDQGYWWKGSGFTTLEGRAVGPTAVAQNAAVTTTITAGDKPFDLPDWCGARERAVTAGPVTVGTGRFALNAGDANGFRVSPRLDRAVLDLATRLVDEQKLGKGATPDMLSVSLSVTDFVGHGYGTEGTEMCIQLHQLDTALGDFFASLDQRGIDYAVVLTADHGGFDLPERLDQQALPKAQRAGIALLPEALSDKVGATLGLDPKGLILADGPAGDFWVKRDLAHAQKAQVVAAAKAELLADPQVAAVFTADELAATALPTASPDTWTLLQRARASFYAPRSGDFVVLLQRGVVALPKPGPGYVATHGSPWDYDRRVPMLFWRKGMAGFEQPSPVETVDIAPTLAALIGLNVPAGTFDGRCLDLDAGAGSTCGVTP